MRGVVLKPFAVALLLIACVFAPQAQAVPGKPTGLTATGNHERVVLEWNAVAGAIIHYGYDQSSDEGMTWKGWTTTGGTETSFAASILGAEVPPDPAVACPTLQLRGREHRQGEPRTVTMRDVPQRVPDLGQRTEIMVRLHQLLEPSFLLRADNIDDDFGQSHRSSSTLNGLVRVTSYHGNEGLIRPGDNILKVPNYSAGTDPPCSGSFRYWIRLPFPNGAVMPCFKCRRYYGGP